MLLSDFSPCCSFLLVIADSDSQLRYFPQQGLRKSNAGLDAQSVMPMPVRPYGRLLELSVG